MDLGCCWMLFFLQRRICWPTLEECYDRESGTQLLVKSQITHCNCISILWFLEVL
jgi:hypothetical protein